MTARTYMLLGPDRKPYESATSGALGGYRPGRVYGRLDCPAALRAIARGGYVRNRVFFADEQTAVAAGYRPCAVCLPDEYARWKAGSLSEVGAADALVRLPSRHSTDVASKVRRVDFAHCGPPKNQRPTAATGLSRMG